MSFTLLHERGRIYRGEGTALRPIWLRRLPAVLAVLLCALSGLGLPYAVRPGQDALTAACAVLSVIWVPVSFVVMPSITDDVAFCAIFSWCVLPLAFIRCIVSNCRFYKLAARYGL